MSVANILWLVVVIVAFWLIDLVANIAGNPIHLLLVVALLVLAYNLLTGHRRIYSPSSMPFGDGRLELPTPFACLRPVWQPPSISAAGLGSPSYDVRYQSGTLRVVGP